MGWILSVQAVLGTQAILVFVGMIRFAGVGRSSLHRLAAVNRSFQTPAPPASPTPVHFPNTTGVYAQGQWGEDFDKRNPGGGTPIINISLGDPLWLYNLLVNLARLPYLDPFDPNHRLFGTHWCGLGGGGNITGSYDDYCKPHYTCYDDAGVTAGDNWRQLPPDKAAKLQHCNQIFCDGLKEVPGRGAAVMREFFRIFPNQEARCQ